MTRFDFCCWLINKFGPVYLLFALLLMTKIAR